MVPLDAEARRLVRAATWSTRVYRGDVHAAMEADDLTEWASLSPVDRFALTWALSLEQEGLAHDADVPARLPRSRYRVEPR
jgi:hypothetical protein